MLEDIALMRALPNMTVIVPADAAETEAAVRWAADYNGPVYIRMGKAAKDTGAILTCEEHTIMGGLGSAVAEVVCKNNPVPMGMVGTEDTFGESGKAEDLLEKYGLTVKHIEEEAIRLLERK